MRYYFFGDIHGNSYALHQCLKHLEELSVDKVYCLGDLVGWLPFGDRTLEQMRTLGIATVAGNHDLLVSGLFTDYPTQLDRIQASAYNAGLLSTVSGADEYLLNLPLIIEERAFVVVHHSPFRLPAANVSPSIECFNYLDEAELSESLGAWQDYPKHLIFSGHDHLPAVYELPKTNRSPTSAEVVTHRPPRSSHLSINLDHHSRYWVKAGSVGGPYRDGVAVCNTVLYDSTAQTLTLFRLPYPTATLQRELASNRFFANLPTLQRFNKLLKEVEPGKRKL